MNDDLKDAFVAAAIATFDKLSECPEITNYRVYREPDKNFRSKLYKRTAVGIKSAAATKALSYKPFRWVLVVSAQKSARRADFKIRGYRQA